MHIALIGVGYWGPNLLRNLHASQRCDITVVDLNQERLQRTQANYPSIQVSSDSDEVINDPKIDAVVIATPVASHETLIEKAILAGKHVFAEKPLTGDLKSSRRLQQLSREHQKILFVGHIFLYHPTVLKIKSWIDAGELGDIFTITSTRTNLGPIRDDVNALWDLAPHDLSIISYWLNAGPSSVSATGQAILREGHLDTVFANFNYPNNILAQVHVSWITPKKIRQFTIVGSKQLLIWDDMNVLEPVRLYNKGVGNTFHDLNYLQHLSAVGDGEVRIPKMPMGEPLSQEVNAFLDLVEQNKLEQNKLDPNLDIAVDTVMALEGAQRSIAEQKSITLQ